MTEVAPVTAVAPASPAPAVRFENVERSYANRHAVNGVTLEVAGGSFAVILGPSGCGKTTLLKTVNRLLEPTAGRVLVDGTDVASIDPTALRRSIGYVIQQVGLFPHLTVAENVGVVPGLLGWPRTRISARVDELLDLVHLPPDQFRARYPRQLSGGQQQRVGLARALAGDPGILLMDEPFGAVDAIERAHLQAEILGLRRRLRKTILFVTHDVDEALRLGDVLVVMRDGRVEQCGTPVEVLARPANRFVAALVNADDVLRRLDVVTAEAAMTSGGSKPDSEARIGAGATLRVALSTFVTTGASMLTVVDAGGAALGSLSLSGLLAFARDMGAAEQSR